MRAYRTVAPGRVWPLKDERTAEAGRDDFLLCSSALLWDGGWLRPGGFCLPPPDDGASDTLKDE